MKKYISLFSFIALFFVGIQQSNAQDKSDWVAGFPDGCTQDPDRGRHIQNHGSGWSAYPAGAGSGGRQSLPVRPKPQGCQGAAFQRTQHLHHPVGG